MPGTAAAGGLGQRLDALGRAAAASSLLAAGPGPRRASSAAGCRASPGVGLLGVPGRRGGSVPGAAGPPCRESPASGSRGSCLLGVQPSLRKESMQSRA